MELCLASSLRHSIFEGVRRVVSIWNFVRMYRPIIGCLNKILGSGGTSYPTYLDPLMPLFGIFSLWKPATSVKMNGYIRKLNQFFVWILSLDWYLNWPHWIYNFWDMVHWQLLSEWCWYGAWFNRFFLQNFCFAFWVNRPWRKRFCQKNFG